MIKFENGVGEIKGNAPTILFETTEILRCVRKSLEERMSKEDADKWIDKVVRRSAMTEKEEIIDSIKGVKDGLKKLRLYSTFSVTIFCIQNCKMCLSNIILPGK